MLVKLLFLFTVIPLLELWLLIEVGRIIGTWLTISIVALTGFLGVLLARSQGVRVLFNMRAELRQGRLPTDELLNGVCILVGGAFLLTPGLLTDLFGFSLLIPLTRNPIKKVVVRLIRKMFKVI
ncbi:MAG: FxsA family protein [Dethiobacter sp.]|jgi:UPF0716 protein FxsA|nr:MAG: FxsA family protein [Dethiobacter sp.]